MVRWRIVQGGQGAGRGSSGWWLASLAAGLPGVGLVVAAGNAGLGSALGLTLAGGGVAALAAAALAIQPIIDRATLARGDQLAEAARAYLARALLARSLQDLQLELEAMAQRTLGVSRTLLIVPAAEGGVRVLGADVPASALEDAEAAFTWLGGHAEPASLGYLAQIGSEPGPAATSALMTRLGAAVAMPLLHRGMLLGVAMLSAPSRPPPDEQTFFRILGAHTTVALANSYLDAEARGKGTLSKDLDLASAMQEAIMPDERPVRRPGFQLRGAFRPVAECGGDMWSWAELGNGKLLIFVGDATGHGAAPAMLTAVAKGALETARQVLGDDLDPAELLSAMNRAVHRAGRTRYLMTGFAAVLDLTTGELKVANAGHNFPYVVQRGDSSGRRAKLEQIIARGNTLGAVAEASYTTSSRTIAIGEKLVLYSDGIIDAGAPQIEPFGEKRLRAALLGLADQSAPRTCEGVMAEVDGFLANRPTADDMTLLIVERLAETAPVTAPKATTEFDGGAA